MDRWRSLAIGRAVTVLAELGLPSDPYGLRGSYRRCDDGRWEQVPDGAGCGLKELIAAAFPGNRDALFAVQILLADDDVARAAEAGDQEAAAQGLAYLRSFVARWDLDRDADRGRKLIERTRRGGRKGAAVRRNEAEPKRGQIAALVAELTPREGLKAAKYAAMERFGVSLSTVERAVKKSTVTS